MKCRNYIYSATPESCPLLRRPTPRLRSRSSPARSELPSSFAVTASISPSLERHHPCIKSVVPIICGPPGTLFDEKLHEAC